MEDVVDNMTQPEVTITTNTGKDVTFDGLFSYYTAILNILFNGTKGNVYFGENAKLDVSKLNIQNADNVGTDGRPLHVNLFVAKDNNNNLKRPELIVDAAGNDLSPGRTETLCGGSGNDLCTGEGTGRCRGSEDQQCGPGSDSVHQGQKDPPGT